MILGRDAELAQMERVLDHAAAARTQNLLIVGDAGTGKSALLTAAEEMARARGFRVVRTSSPEGSAEFRYAVVEDLARGLPEALAQVSADDARVLTGQQPAASSGPSRVATALLHLLSQAARESPVVVLADDVHWADPASLAALTLAAGRLHHLRVALVGSLRPRPVTDPVLRAAPRLDLGALDPQSARAVLLAGLPPALAGSLSPERADQVAQALARHPLALTECARLLTPAQILGREPIPDPIPLDDRLVRAWGGAYRQLGERTRHAVLAVCVARGGGAALLDAVLAEHGADRSDLRPAVAARLVTATPKSGSAAPELGHPLMSAAIRAVAGVERVREMHRCTAGAARRLGLPPDVAITHVAAGAMPGDPDGIKELEELAQQAVGADQPAAAAKALTVAAELSLDGDERGRLGAQAARTLLGVTRNLTGAGRLVAVLSRTTLSGEDRVWAEWLQAEYLAERDLRHALARLRHAAELARSERSPALLPILWSATFAAWSVGSADVALEMAREYAEEIGVADAGVAQALPPWAGHALLGLTLFQVGQVAEASRVLAVAHRMSNAWELKPDTDLGLLVTVVMLDEGMGLHRPFDDPRLQEVLRRLLGDTGETLAFMRNIEAARAIRRGDMHIARTLVEAGLHLSRVVGFRQNIILRLCTAVRIDAVLGDRESLDQHTAELRGLANELGHVWALAYVHRADGLLALGEGRLDAALLHLHPLTGDYLLGLASYEPVPTGRADLVEVLVRLGDQSAAQVLATDLEALLGPFAEPFTQGLLARCRGLVAHGSAAAAELRASVALFTQDGDAFETARSRLLLGEVLRRERDTAGARWELSAAAAEFERIGALPWQARAQAELRAAGSTPATPPNTDDQLAPLTAQERRVALEVARGGTNREVAAALFLSHRTVEHHLASAYRKLGVTSRTALVRHLARMDPVLPGGTEAGPPAPRAETADG